MTWPLFLIPVLSGLAAQSLKPILNKKREPAAENLPRYGGMPSAHTAFAVSLAVTVALYDGIVSTNFALATAFLIYTLDDALRLRIFVGRYGLALRHLVKKLPVAEQKLYPFIESKLGHSSPEVTAGAVLGLIITLLIWMLIK